MPILNESLLRTRIFISRGFRRGRCPYCGHYYWTLNPSQDNCGDQPCTPYGFISNPPGTYRPESIKDVRERFLSFFEKRGHIRVARYPVVARWRNDVYLVGASIYDFQPWVTEGVVPPPANPLTISQPSIRLTDVDKVGRSGRHLTGFEMMAHHAFNFPGKEVYWINETVEYAHEFFTRELGFRDDEVTYKENIWEGGGNAGESFEVLVRGLELATLVFMHYRVIGDEYREMPIRIVDTGYGLERIYWVLTGKPTIYEAVFGGFLNKARQLLGLPKPDEKMLASLAIHMGQLDPEVLALDKAYVEVAKRIGVNSTELINFIKPQEALYVLADHSRTVSWMINDGVIPSNSGVGYLARLLIRRMLKYMHIIDAQIPLTEIFNAHLNYLINDYPELKESMQLILDLVDLEEAKYKSAISQLPKLISRIKGELTINDLINLYDSHGIPPEVVRDEAAKRGVGVNVPDNFYEMLAAKHQKPAKGEEGNKLDVTADDVIDLPPTRELFYENTYMFEGRAKVLKVIKSKYVILDSTVFYPEGGGQPADRGVLRFNGTEAKVIDVQRVGPVIVHVIEGPAPGVGDVVEMRVDSERRLGLMRMHTGTHILLQSIRRVLGKHVWQAGAQKDIPLSRLDVTHYRLPTQDEVRRIEELANEVVLSDLPVKVELMPRNEAEAKYGFIIYQGGVVPGGKVRIVKVGEGNDVYDVEACGGTHLDRTSRVGLIKIVKVDKIQEGVIRFIFTTGKYALDYVRNLEGKLDSVANKLKVGRDDADNAVDRLLRELNNVEERSRILARKAIEADLANIVKSMINIGEFKVAVYYEDYWIKDYLQELASKYPGDVLILIHGKEYQVYTNGKVKAINVAKILNELGGKGGGGSTFAQGVFNNPVKQDDVVNAIKGKLI
ncbi:alanine--tRNA ligase [Caldivirga sp. UBA161]|uniref:alanine--tRNA ligase n=1 Tax=Caldivirga sp. UBA161 TaxID=1915569 RepID=UPI0025BE4400|nr:alanine--tRNA ligase [Caldivirga sp. UBA161]